MVSVPRWDESRFADAGKNRAFYEATQTYGLPVVYEQMAERTEDPPTTCIGM